MPEQCTLVFDSSASDEIPVGSKIGNLTIIGPPIRTSKGKKYPCRCDCGFEMVLRINLNRNPTSHCWQCRTIHGEARIGNRTRLYTIWRGMIGRCLWSPHPKYHRYGGRGITICKEWMEYIPFRDWAKSNGYADDLSIDREDNNGNYEPGNCRWVTMAVQSHNRRQIIWITAFGETKVLAEWLLDSRCLVSPSGYKLRIRKGWTPNDALFTPAAKVGNRKSK